MPYKSDKQRRYLHAKEPEVAEKFDEEIRKGRKSSKRKASRGSKRRSRR